MHLALLARCMPLSLLDNHHQVMGGAPELLPVDNHHALYGPPLVLDDFVARLWVGGYHLYALGGGEYRDGIGGGNVDTGEVVSVEILAELVVFADAEETARARDDAIL